MGKNSINQMFDLPVVILLLAGMRAIISLYA